MSDDVTIAFRAPRWWKDELQYIADNAPGKPAVSVVIRQAAEAKHPTLRKKPKEPRQ